MQVYQSPINYCMGKFLMVHFLCVQWGSKYQTLKHRKHKKLTYSCLAFKWSEKSGCFGCNSNKGLKVVRNIWNCITSNYIWILDHSPTGQLSTLNKSSTWIPTVFYFNEKWFFHMDLSWEKWVILSLEEGKQKACYE